MWTLCFADSMSDCLVTPRGVRRLESGPLLSGMIPAMLEIVSREQSLTAKAIWSVRNVARSSTRRSPSASCAAPEVPPQMRRNLLKRTMQNTLEETAPLSHMVIVLRGSENSESRSIVPMGPLRRPHKNLSTMDATRQAKLRVWEAKAPRDPAATIFSCGLRQKSHCETTKTESHL